MDDLPSCKNKIKNTIKGNTVKVIIFYLGRLMI